eukprot:jgi/Botrbrau1/15642/Bobra.4_1s0027.2
MFFHSLNLVGDSVRAHGVQNVAIPLVGRRRYHGLAATTNLGHGLNRRYIPCISDSSSDGPEDADKPPSRNLGPTVLKAVAVAVPAIAAIALVRQRHLQTQAQTSTGGSGGGSGPGAPGGGGSGDQGGGGGSQRGLKTAEPLKDEEKKKAEKKEVLHLTLVSFAVTRRAYQRITELFAREYKEKTGYTVRFRLSFGGSGTQSRAVCDGLPGDIVALALPLDVMKIEEAGLLSPGWQKRFPNNSIVAESTVAIAMRPGNPKRIKGWDDLIRKDVSVITANPKTAGGARWNFFALWGHRVSKGDAASLDFVTKVFENVLVQPRDAREASDAFYKQQLGDVLLNYENEVILTNETYKDNPMPYVVPNNNVRVQMPVAIVDKNVALAPKQVRQATVDAAEAFVNFLFTPVAQEEFVKCGIR